MCHYCGKSLENHEHIIEMNFNGKILCFCEKECAILYHQEQQQINFQTWVAFR